MNKTTKILISTISFLFIILPHSDAQRLVFEKNIINVGKALWQKPVTATFNFSNKHSKTPVVIQNVDAGCGCINADWPNTSIARGEKGKITVTYDAQLLGHFDKIIEVHTNLDEKPLRIRMKGIVTDYDQSAYEKLYPYRIDNVCLNTNNIEFTDVHKGDSVTTTLELLNDGTEVYTPLLMHLPEYITAVAKPASLACGRRGKIELTLHADLVPNLGLNQTSVYVARFAGDRVATNNDITVSAVLLPDVQEERNNTPTPSFNLSAEDLNLGKLGKKSKLKGSVIITNKGTALLTLNTIQSFDQAIAVSLPKRELQPGESIKMNIVLDSKYLGLSKAKPRILIITNDPNNTKGIINVNFENN